MLAAAEVRFPPESAMLKRIAWIKRKADSLGKTRNDAAHLVVDFEFGTTSKGLITDEGRLIAHPFAMPEKRIRGFTDAKTLENRFKYAAGDIIALQTYALGVLYKMANAEGMLPRRPRLRSVPDRD
jgi:hypothetical protein